MSDGQILREVPWRRVALVLLVVVANLAFVSVTQGRAIGHRRFAASHVIRWGGMPEGIPDLDFLRQSTPCVMPWAWSQDEWGELLPGSPSRYGWFVIAVENMQLLEATRDVVKLARQQGDPAVRGVLLGNRTFAISPGGECLLDGDPILDTSGRPLRYRCPGKEPGHGWEVYAAWGDMTLGEDVAVERSAR